MAVDNNSCLPDEEVLQLISAYFDKQLSEEEFSQLSKWLVDDPANARWFARISAIHSDVKNALQQEDLLGFLETSS